MTDYIAVLARIHAEMKEQTAATKSMASVIILQKECLEMIVSGEVKDPRLAAQATLNGCRELMIPHQLGGLK